MQIIAMGNNGLVHLSDIMLIKTIESETMFFLGLCT